MIEKPISRLVQTLEARSFTVIGCAGVGGIGLDATQSFGAALAGAEGDFIVLLGDVCPIGRDPFYKNTVAFVDAVSGGKPVCAVPGTRDGPMFQEYFGQRDRAVLSEEFTLIMLDNSGGSFSPESLSFLRDTLAITNTPNTIVAFALPPPNRFSGRSMTEAAWGRFEEAAGVWRKRISLFIAGSVPSYFEDEIDGVRLVVTGGGGGAIRHPPRASPAHPHVVEVRMDDGGRIGVVQKILPPDALSPADPGARRRLDEAFLRESRAHIDLLLSAEEAEKRGVPNLARFFRATAASRLRLTRNIRAALTGRADPAACLKRVLERIEAEESERYERIAFSEGIGDVQALHVFRDSLSNDFVHMGLFEQARDELAEADDIEPSAYHICSSCGILFSGCVPPENCSECGAPAEFISEVL